jgi:hypothetical protein
VVIRCVAEDHNNLPDDARLFIEVVADGNRLQKAELVRLEPAVSWRLDETIEL